MLPSDPHPAVRFFIFNVVVIALMATWLAVRSSEAEVGLAGLPNYAVTTAGVVVLAAIWLGSWVAWGFMVWSRRRNHRAASRP